jgi:acyl-CoA dehydrogenase
MQFEHTDKVKALIARLEAFMAEHVYPVEKLMAEEIADSPHPWRTPPRIEALKARARAAGLWNLFFPHEHGGQLTNLEYAPLAEIMGRVLWASEVFNCSAPDTGNMETIAKYGSDAQKKEWLEPLLAGEIRSAFCMTEPAVASSDATNIECSIVRDGSDYVINGRKWYSTGGMRESCGLFIVMGKTAPDNPDKHRRQSMILVPRDTPGVRIVRSVTTFGYREQPYGEPEIAFEDVRVPASNILLREGAGFEIAQGRLGPGRIHHCMRLIGCAQRALEQMCRRAEERTTFGRKLSQHQSVREDIARSFCEIEQARLLTLMAADRMDRHGNKVARDLIAAIKIVAPTMALNVLDRCIQVHGAAGLTADFFMAEAFNYARQLRLADGPDQVHMMQLGRDQVARHAPPPLPAAAG